jgi:threonine synthase
MVKRIFADKDVTDKHRIGAVKSINWARLMAQVV